METQTLKIKVPKGFEIDNLDKTTGEITFKEKPKSVMERIKTVEDLLEDHGLTQVDFDDNTEGFTEDEKAYKLLKMLAESLNEGWKPNWKKSNEYKYVCWFEMEGSSGFRFNGLAYWGTSSAVGSRLCFRSRELANHAGKHFIDVWKKYMIID